MKPALLIENVTKTYGDGDQAVNALINASLEVQPGQLVAIVGPSGSGKTTLLAIAGALLQPTNGSITVDGEKLAELSAARMADIRLRKIGFILQSSNLVPFLRARDQLLLIPYLAGHKNRDAEERADALLEELGLTNRRNHYPESLSGGERQRIAIARSLMNDPAVILADEPTASLDSARGRKVVEMLSRLVKEHGKAGVMVTHDERMLDLADRIYRIADGVIQDSEPAPSAEAILSRQTSTDTTGLAVR